MGWIDKTLKDKALSDSLKNLNHIEGAIAAGKKFIGTTATKALAKATKRYEITFALKSLETLGKYYAGTIISNIINYGVREAMK